ncbi:MAG TPA: hypothetical protein VIN08_01335 [Ohtaekwangia sp.]|uniref:hypothetical protein n=1 Tax=Ohtaekwangia sp. TaxID=2066019 RepID=UPI002F95D241
MDEQERDLMAVGFDLYLYDQNTKQTSVQSYDIIPREGWINPILGADATGFVMGLWDSVGKGWNEYFQVKGIETSNDSEKLREALNYILSRIDDRNRKPQH